MLELAQVSPCNHAQHLVLHLFHHPVRDDAGHVGEADGYSLELLRILALDKMVLETGQTLGHCHSPDKAVVVEGVETWTQTNAEIGERFHVESFHVPLQVNEEVSENWRTEGFLELPQPHEDESKLVVWKVFNF